MALNDRLIGEGATLWWHEEITRQLERMRIQRDTKEEDIEKEEGESEND